jgi:hypothetical protein
VRIGNSKYFLGKDCRNRLADLDINFHIEYQASPRLREHLYHMKYKHMDSGRNSVLMIQR